MDQKIQVLYEEFRTNIVANFYLLSKQQGWTQQSAAEKINCNRTHLSKIFSGKRNPSIKLLEKMDEVFKNYYNREILQNGN